MRKHMSKFLFSKNALPSPQWAPTLVTITYYWFLFHRKMRKGKSEVNDLVPFDANDNVTTDFDGKNFKLSIHMSGGVFKRKQIRSNGIANDW